MCRVFYWDTVRALSRWPFSWPFRSGMTEHYHGCVYRLTVHLMGWGLLLLCFGLCACLYQACIPAQITYTMSVLVSRRSPINRMWLLCTDAGLSGRKHCAHICMILLSVVENACTQHIIGTCWLWGNYLIFTLMVLMTNIISPLISLTCMASWWSKSSNGI